MKTSTFLMGAAAILAGCVVTSVCPYYTQKDLVTEPALPGNWTNVHNPGENWKFEQTVKLACHITR